VKKQRKHGKSEKLGIKKPRKLIILKIDSIRVWKKVEKSLYKTKKD
jgi:hypothetical protein